MRVHFVLAHPEPRSFNAALVERGVAALTALGHTSSVTDLYAEGFDPCEGPAHFSPRLDPDRFEAQSEQRHAHAQGALPEPVRLELERVDAADLVVLQYPMWWHMPPAMMKGWFDRVFAYGSAYTSKMRFEDGRFTGKRAMISVTVGTSRETYAHDGRSGDIDLMLWPINFSLAYVGFEVLAPFVAYGVEAGIRYSDPTAVEARLDGILHSFGAAFGDLDTRPTIPFNRKAEWGADGRIVPDAPVYSPFIRRKEKLDLE